MKPNRGHFHVWVRHRDGRMQYQASRGGHWQQAGCAANGRSETGPPIRFGLRLATGRVALPRSIRAPVVKYGKSPLRPPKIAPPDSLWLSRSDKAPGQAAARFWGQPVGPRSGRFRAWGRLICVSETETTQKTQFDRRSKLNAASGTGSTLRRDGAADDVVMAAGNGAPLVRVGKISGSGSILAASRGQYRSRLRQCAHSRTVRFTNAVSRIGRT